jgi:hypothetical protein
VKGAGGKKKTLELTVLSENSQVDTSIFSLQAIQYWPATFLAIMSP